MIPVSVAFHACNLPVLHAKTFTSMRSVSVVIATEKTITTDAVLPIMISKTRSCVQLMHNNMNDDDDDNLEPSSLFLSGSVGDNRERLLLPRRGSLSCPMDEYLSRIPRVVSRARELHASAAADEFWGVVPQQQQPRNLEESAESSLLRCLNVLQGEVAHASSLQADCLVSAEATTCHVVALRSTSSRCDGGASVPLCSLAHIDRVYDSCLEAMVKEHLQHHEKNHSNSKESVVDESFGFFMDDEEFELPLNDVAGTADKTNNSSFLPQPPPRQQRTASMPEEMMQQPPMIEMELHMVGGFLDKEGTSQQLSTSLVERFSDLAEKYRDRVRISLSTAAISCMNNNNSSDDENNNDVKGGGSGPVNRGLGIDTRTGQVFAVKSALPAHLEGPAVELRSARASFCCEESSESCPSSRKKLAVIHDASSEHIRVEPFSYKADPEWNVLLKVSDQVLLNVTSTSPDQESDAFCSNFRRTLSFVSTVPPETVFGHHSDGLQRPLVYSRSSTNLNEWVEAYQ